jgi:hypothetical protein
MKYKIEDFYSHTRRFVAQIKVSYLKHADISRKKDWTRTRKALQLQGLRDY